MTTAVNKKDTFAQKVKTEIRVINTVIRSMRIKGDDPLDQNAKQQIIQLMNMYVQNGDKLMYEVLNEIAKAMLGDPTAQKVITYEETEVDVPEYIVFYPDYIKNKMNLLEKLLGYDEKSDQPKQAFKIDNPIFSIPPNKNYPQPTPTFTAFNQTGTSVFNQTGTPAFNPTGTPAFNPTGTPTFNPTGTPTFNPTGTSVFNQTGVPTFNSTGTPAFNTTGTPAFNQTGAPTFNPTGTTTTKPTGTYGFNPTSTTVVGK
jgi:hypothetical protein